MAQVCLSEQSTAFFLEIWQQLDTLGWTWTWKWKGHQYLKSFWTD